VKIYPSEFAWAEKIKNIPKALREKEFAKQERLFFQQGFKAVGQGEDRNGHWVEILIRPGTTLQAVNTMLAEYSTAAVTVQPEDVEPLYGRNIMTLGMKRKLEYDGNACVSMLEPSELVDALDNLRVTAQFGGGPVSEEVEQFIEMDLFNEGYITDQEVASHDRWLNPTASPSSVIGAFDNIGDGEDWKPDTSVDEWADQ